MEWIETLTPEEFRQKIAGLTSTDVAFYEPERFKALAVRLGFVMAKLFNRSVLDPMSLWERIGNGLRVAAAKVGNGDTDKFIDICLDFIQADPVRVAADEDCAALIYELADQEEPFRRQWIRYINERVFVITTFARRDWMSYRDRDKIESAYPTEVHAA